MNKNVKLCTLAATLIMLLVEHHITLMRRTNLSLPQSTFYVDLCLCRAQRLQVIAGVI